MPKCTSGEFTLILSVRNIIAKYMLVFIHKCVYQDQGFKSRAKAFSGGAAKMMFSGL
jgi:hypothetical protein